MATTWATRCCAWSRQLRRVSGGGHAYRYGGEEFTLVFPGKTAAESMPHLEAVRAIEAYQMRLRDKPARPRTDQAGLRRRGARRDATRGRCA